MWNLLLICQGDNLNFNLTLPHLSVAFCYTNSIGDLGKVVETTFPFVFYPLPITMCLKKRDKWYDYYQEKIEEVRKRNPGCTIMTKEKYWRFDISAYDLATKFDYDYLWYLEEESIDRCMDCWKIAKQYETWFYWRMRHWCLKCYIKQTLKYWWQKTEWYVKNSSSYIYDWLWIDNTIGWNEKKEEKFVKFYKKLYGDTSKELPTISKEDEEKHKELWKKELTKILWWKKNANLCYKVRPYWEQSWLDYVFGWLWLCYWPKVK